MESIESVEHFLFLCWQQKSRERERRREGSERERGRERERESEKVEVGKSFCRQAAINVSQPLLTRSTSRQKKIMPSKKVKKLNKTSNQHNKLCCGTSFFNQSQA